MAGHATLAARLRTAGHVRTPREPPGGLGQKPAQGVRLGNARMPVGRTWDIVPSDMSGANATVIPTAHRRKMAARSQNGRTPDHELIESAELVLGVLAGKWKVHLLCSMARGIHRHCRLLDCLPGGSK